MVKVLVLFYYTRGQLEGEKIDKADRAC